MRNFRTIREAKDYLASRIAAEAEQGGNPLSEIERKMLYFSETDWTLPEMAEVSAQFDAEYDQDEYERKVSGLVRKITARHHGNKKEEEESWDDAVAKLSEGDHYILVLVSSDRSSAIGFLSSLGSNRIRPPRDILKLWLTAFAVIFLGLGVVALWNWLFRSQ